jgi:hypothetical protein
MEKITRLERPIRQFFFMLVLSAAPALAQRDSPAVIEQGTWDISPWIAGATGEETTNSFAQAQIWTAGIFAGKVLTGEFGRGWRRANLEFGITLIPIFVQTRTQTVYGGGFEPVVLRFNSGHQFGRAVPYIELAGGAIATTANIPPGPRTSDFNFTARGGGGFNIFRKSRQSFDVGCRWYHASNANLAAFNPEFNGIQVGLAYHWYK